MTVSLTPLPGIATGMEESSLAFNCNSNDGDERTDQPNLVYTQALNYIRKIKERSAEQGKERERERYGWVMGYLWYVAQFLKY